MQQTKKLVEVTYRASLLIAPVLMDIFRILSLFYLSSSLTSANFRSSMYLVENDGIDGESCLLLLLGHRCLGLIFCLTPPPPIVVLFLPDRKSVV